MIKYLKPIFYIIGIIMKSLNIPTILGGFKIRFPKFMNSWELGSTILGGYEKNERKLVKKYLKENDSVLELGACVGVVSLTINKILKDKTKQVSVEPNPQMLHYLQENKKNNNGLFNIETCIVTKLKEVNFFIGGEAFLGSTTLGKGNSTTIPGKTLNNLIEQYFPFTVIVMDIEGGELEFFRTFDLKNSTVRLLVWETHMHPSMLKETELQECYELLTKQGFNLIEKSDKVEAWGTN
jgi:FkbM family methyltransferase